MLPSNCLIWALKQKILFGGHLNWHKAKTWWGFHTSWTDNTGTTWEYTITDQHKRKWWYLPIVYYGIIRIRN